ncbi:MAG TPA: 2-oxoacid:acceptor oxidoreductase family protein, partial [Terriglobia bacterium]|nr:2-oxoacid:acceptor oxidoreductase family protein [Terriglobia bacterium]
MSGSATRDDLVLRIGGESGEGVITVAESVSRIAARMGLCLSTYRTFPAEIKGGACMMQLRVSETPVHHPGDQADMVVAFNEQALRDNLASLRPGGLLIYEAAMEGDAPDGRGIRCLPVPFRSLALDAVGNAASKNIVVLGVLAG